MRLADEDGTSDTNQANHERRNAHLSQDFDGGWSLDASCGSLSGAELHAIFARFSTPSSSSTGRKPRSSMATPPPRSTSSARTRSVAPTPSTPSSNGPRPLRPGARAPRSCSTSSWTWLPTSGNLAALATGGRASADPDDESYRCSTIDGHQVEATEAVVASLLGKLRRVVIGSDSVVIDLGHTQRLFTGSARLAAMLTRECFWPGCHVPASQCQIDHLTPYTERGDGGGGGSTNPGNGGPACGRHNRHKEAGYTVWRDPAGRWHVLRPDSTEIV